MPVMPKPVLYGSMLEYNHGHKHVHIICLLVKGLYY